MSEQQALAAFDEWWPSSPLVQKDTAREIWLAAWNRRAPGWLPVESARKDDLVLVYGLAGYDTAYLSSAFDEWCDSSGNRVDTPLAWQPLPQPPE